MFVAWACEKLRDGEESVAQIFTTKAEALTWMDMHANGFAGCNKIFRLFELGKELPVTPRVEEEPQPSIMRTRYKVRT